MKIGILGSGSLGIIIGALITQSGKYEVDLIDSNIKNVNALNENGAQITGFLNTNISVNAISIDNLHDKYDLIILLTKQLYTIDALTNMLPFLHENSTVCTLQNGVPENLVASVVGEKRTIGGSVGFGATWVSPGISELTTELATMKNHAFDIGELSGENTPRINIVQEVLSHVGKCNVSSNIKGVKWSKLLMNVTFSGMSAALGCQFKDILNNNCAMKSIMKIADETLTIGNKINISFAILQGRNFELLKLDKNINQKQYKELLNFYLEVWGPHSNLKASMLQDIEKRQSTEIQFINGIIVDLGKELNIETPYNTLVVNLIKKAEENGSVPNFQNNLELFKKLNNKYFTISN